MARIKEENKSKKTASVADVFKKMEKVKLEKNNSRESIEDDGSNEEEIQKYDKHEDSSENESCDEEEMILNAYTNPEETINKKENKFPLEIKLELIEKLKSLNKRKTSTYKVALRHFDWKQVMIEGYTTEELKTCLNEILKPICTIRTLEEILTNYEDHHQKYDLKMHPDAPKLPRNAVMQFIDDNRDKIKKSLSKEFPDKLIGLKDISSYGAKKFTELPVKEQEKYKAQYKRDLKEYNEKKAELLKQFPELVRKRPVPVKKESNVKTPKRSRANTDLSSNKKSYITSFMIFREELAKEGRDVTYQEAQGLYKNMPDDEKMKYIQKLVIYDTPLEKQFTSQERKIMKNSNGMPAKPLSAYNLFVKDLFKSDMTNKKEVLKLSSNLWKTLDQEKKLEYELVHKKSTEEWQEKMEAWFKTLPVEQRAEQMAKHGFLTKVEATKNRRKTIKSFFHSDNSSANVSQNNEKETKPEPMIIKKEDSKVTPVINIIPPSTPEASKVQILSVDSLDKESSDKESSKKKRKAFDLDILGIEPSQKKRKFKDVIASFGAYPSLKTAHYYMSQKYNGKAHKVAKAYRKLDKTEKKKLCHEMKKIKKNYFSKLRKYAEENEKHVDKIREFHTKNRTEQDESITWHVEDGTDHSDSSDSDSDSD